MSSLHWKLNRLRLMGLGEIAWRAQQVVQKKLASAGVGLCPHPPTPQADRCPPSWLPDSASLLAPGGLTDAADRVLSGRWQVFALRDAALGFPPQWNRCPKTGTHAPVSLGKGIDYRNESVVGDIKYLWEPSRHLELTTLAQAWAVTKDPRYLGGVRDLLTSWFDQCPYPNGVHWTSSLELAVRLLNWSFAWHLVGGLNSQLFADAEGRRLQGRWLDAIYQHQHFIAGYFSKHSSANNHLLGEYMGLFVASVTWPCWSESAAWLAVGQAGFEREALLQNTDDGVNKEQAVYYQHEVMDMMLLCQRIGSANSCSFSSAFMARLEKLAEFVAAVMDDHGHMPMIGDSDDAQMVRLSFEAEWSPYRSLLASCAVLFGRADFKHKAGLFDDKNRWLFGTQGLAQWDALPDGSAAPARLTFPQGGYYLLGNQWGTPQEVRLVADAAPLGYLSIAAHGHADALAFTLSYGGEELLIDPGTYAYHTQKVWRDHFRSTAAHNTVCVDGLDQSEIGGNFMWMRKANARLLEHAPSSSGMQSWSAEHDGYARLADPVIHRRDVTFDPVSTEITVIDTLTCKGRHEIAVCWQWAEHLSVVQQGDCILAHGRGATVTVRTNGPQGEWEMNRGTELPRISGWVSRRFDEKSPGTHTSYRATIDGNTQVVTSFRIEARQQATGE